MATDLQGAVITFLQQYDATPYHPFSVGRWDVSQELSLVVERQIDVPFRDRLDERGEPIVITVAITNDQRAWMPIVSLSRALGVDPRAQLLRLQEHEVLNQLLAQLRLRTTGGPQLVWCIERRGVGFWWGSIHLSKVRKSSRPRLLEHQWNVVDAADRALQGEVEADPVRAQLVTHDAQIAAVTSCARSLEQRIGRLEERVLAPEDE